MARIWTALCLNNCAWLLAFGLMPLTNPWCSFAMLDYCFAGAAVCALLGLGGLVLATRRRP